MNTKMIVSTQKVFNVKPDAKVQHIAQKSTVPSLKNNFIIMNFWYPTAYSIQLMVTHLNIYFNR